MSTTISRELRNIITSQMGIKDSPEEEEIEIRPGVKVIYLNTNPMFALTNS